MLVQKAQVSQACCRILNLGNLHCVNSESLILLLFALSCIFQSLGAYFEINQLMDNVARA